MDILKEEKAFDTGVLMHCYSGSAELARQYVKLGAYLSIAGPITYNNARKLVEVVETIPLQHLMIETDAPYHSPGPPQRKAKRDGICEAYSEKIAEIKSISIEEVAFKRQKMRKV